MPFTTTLWEDIESLNFAHQFIYTFTAFVPEIVVILRQSFVRFRPHLLMYKYHVLSMEYFRYYLVYTLEKEDFSFLTATYIPSIVVLS